MSNTSARNKKNKSGTIYFDYSLMFLVIFMMCFGLIVLYSASSYEAAMELNDATFYLRKQAFAMILGFAAMLILSRIDYHLFGKQIIAWMAYIGSILLIMAVLSPIGVEKNGARRWLNLGMSIQPCEVAKLGIIIFMAFFISKFSKQLKYGRVYILSIIIIGIVAGMIAFVTKDLSSAIIIAATGGIMLLVACPRFIYIVFTVILGVAGVAVMLFREAYRMERIQAWLDPSGTSSEGGYQIMQSLYSIGSGGIFGKGLGKGVQKLGYIPEAQNDMIFTVICEELGIVGGIAVIFLFILLISRFMIISNNAPDLYGAMLVVGVMAHISVQTVINIAVVTNSMPNTGVTLPFISYGGSSIMCLLAEIGLVLAVSRRIRFE